jgi:hypothetical protein
MFRPRDISLTAAAVSGFLLLMMPFLWLEGEHLVFRLGTFEQAIPGSCWFHTFTGLECPFCGLSRGFVSAAHFQFGQAWRYNWVAIPSLAFVVFYAAAGFGIVIGRRRKKTGPRWAARAVAYSRAFLGAVLLAGWLARIITGLTS